MDVPTVTGMPASLRISSVGLVTKPAPSINTLQRYCVSSWPRKRGAWHQGVLRTFGTPFSLLCLMSLTIFSSSQWNTYAIANVVNLSCLLQMGSTDDRNLFWWGSFRWPDRYRLRLKRRQQIRQTRSSLHVVVRSIAFLIIQTVLVASSVSL